MEDIACDIAMSRTYLSKSGLNKGGGGCSPSNQTLQLLVQIAFKIGVLLELYRTVTFERKKSINHRPIYYSLTIIINS